MLNYFHRTNIANCNRKCNVSKIDSSEKFLLHNSINYSVVLIFIIIYYLKNKEYFRIQNFLME